uniref:NADH-ubiquinone oxidoreductase chain 3 n=1 Tax=Phanerotoma flava TaxID=684660 RepID=D8WHA8_9HYME|nr:NADH dehydrogenase subunit 3 [Phanerotoma flava]
MMFLLVMFLIVMLIGIVLLLINIFISMKKNNFREKNTSFECGFDVFFKSRMPFSVHFYLIGVLFLVFDIEIILLFPMINSLKILSMFNWYYISMMLLLILFFGLEMEIYNGILKWII